MTPFIITMVCRRNDEGRAWHVSVTRDTEPFRVFVADSRLKALRAAFRWLTDRELQS